MTWWVGYENNLCRYKLQMPGQNQWHVPQVEAVRKNLLSGYSLIYFSECLESTHFLMRQGWDTHWGANHRCDCINMFHLISGNVKSSIRHGLLNNWGMGCFSKCHAMSFFDFFCILYMYWLWLICCFFANIWYDDMYIYIWYCEIYSLRYEQHFDIFQYLQGPTACHGHNHPIMERMAERWCWEYTWYCGNSTLHHVQLHIRYAHSFLFPLCRY